MTISHVYYTSRRKAEKLPGAPDMAVISITDPGTPEASLAPSFTQVLRLSFLDAVPADEFVPNPYPGMFDHKFARRISEFVGQLHQAPGLFKVMVHCEYGVSRSAAVALFVEAYSQAPLEAREYTYAANPWVVQQLEALHPDLEIIPPLESEVQERRQLLRA